MSDIKLPLGKCVQYDDEVKLQDAPSCEHLTLRFPHGVFNSQCFLKDYFLMTQEQAEVILEALSASYGDMERWQFSEKLKKAIEIFKVSNDLP